jgi:hypothetical protein
MPWQRLVADVATEIDKDGLPVYSQVTVQVPRQAGKTTLLLAIEVHRALMWGGPQSIAYTAQTGMDARQKLMRDQVPILEGSGIRAALRKIYRANGTEAVIFRNGSRIDPLPNTPSAGHGRTLDLAIIDEARFDVDDTREAALLPAMVTRPASQLWVISTAGDATSVYFRKKIEDGRRTIETKTQGRRAFFDWSAGDDADIENPRTWWSTIPALGHTQTEDSIRARLETAIAEDKENTFRQEYLCQWRAIESAVIPERYLVRVLNDKTAPTGRLVFGIDVALDRSVASIAVADETGRIELVEARDGVSWVVDRALDLYRRHKAPLVVDGYSPANSLVDRLEAGGVPVVRYSLRDMVAATGSLYDAILEEAVQIRTNAHLEAALRGARRKTMANGWLWSRTDVDVDISPLFAATLAYYHATNRRPPEPKRSVIY